MSAIGPGDWVECIDPRDHPNLCPLGSVFFVEDVGECRGVPSLILKGVAHPTKGFRWVRADCYRPIYRPKQSLIRDLLQPISEDA